MKFLLLTITILALFSSSLGCSCVPTTLKRDYFLPSTKFFVRAVVVEASDPCNGTVEACASQKRFYKLQIQNVYKGCLTQKTIKVVSEGDPSAACGIILVKGISYVLPLSNELVPRINSCQVRISASHLVPGRSVLLASEHHPFRIQ